MNDQEKQLRSELVEAILEYIEEKRTFDSVTMFGITEQSKDRVLQSKHLAEVISSLTSMSNASIQGKKFSREETIQIFN